MANAKKCDRCRKYYDKNLEKDIYGKRIVGVCFVNEVDQSVQDKDLCDECIVKFRNFMVGCELKED